MLAVLAVSFGLVVRWYIGAANAGRTGRNEEESSMLILGIIVLLVGVYLVYALVHPEKF